MFSGTVVSSDVDARGLHAAPDVPEPRGVLVTREWQLTHYRAQTLCQYGRCHIVESHPFRSMPRRRVAEADTPLRHRTGITTTFWMRRSFIRMNSAARFTGSSSESAAR